MSDFEWSVIELLLPQKSRGVPRVDEEKQIIFYRAGKGGTGAEQQKRYVEYLEKCLNIFLQTMTLFSLEILMCNQSGKQPVPI